MPIHHLQLWVPDLARAEKSWGWLLESLGYELARQWDTGRVWRDSGNGAGIVIEQSPDMVPGMLYSRLRPGMNHLAFSVDHADTIPTILDGAPDHGWTRFGTDARHPMPAEVTTAYLEDRDGFEVELIAPS